MSIVKVKNKAGETYDFPSLLSLPFEVYNAYNLLIEQEMKIHEAQARAKSNKSLTKNAAEVISEYNKLNNLLFESMKEHLDGFSDFAKGMSPIELKKILLLSSKTPEDFSELKEEIDFLAQ